MKEVFVKPLNLKTEYSEEYAEPLTKCNFKKEEISTESLEKDVALQEESLKHKTKRTKIISGNYEYLLDKESQIYNEDTMYNSSVLRKRSHNHENKLRSAREKSRIRGYCPEDYYPFYHNFFTQINCGVWQCNICLHTLPNFDNPCIFQHFEAFHKAKMFPKTKKSAYKTIINNFRHCFREKGNSVFECYICKKIIFNVDSEFMLLRFHMEDYHVDMFKCIIARARD